MKPAKTRDVELVFARKICANFSVERVETLSLMDCLYKMAERLVDCRNELKALRSEGSTFPVEVTDAAKENQP